MKRNFKTLRLGDFIRVYGVINYDVEKKMVDNGWGNEPVVITRKSLEVTGANAESLERNMYTEEDLSGVVKPDLLEEEKALGFSLNEN